MNSYFYIMIKRCRPSRFIRFTEPPDGLRVWQTLWYSQLCCDTATPPCVTGRSSCNSICSNRRCSDGASIACSAKASSDHWANFHLEVTSLGSTEGGPQPDHKTDDERDCCNCFRQLQASSWLSFGLTFHSTRNRLLWRRSPRRSLD